MARYPYHILTCWMPWIHTDPSGFVRIRWNQQPCNPKHALRGRTPQFARKSHSRSLTNHTSLCSQTSWKEVAWGLCIYLDSIPIKNLQTLKRWRICTRTAQWFRSQFQHASNGLHSTLACMPFPTNFRVQADYPLRKCTAQEQSHIACWILRSFLSKHKSFLLVKS